MHSRPVVSLLIIFSLVVTLPIGTVSATSSEESPQTKINSDHSTAIVKANGVINIKYQIQLKPNDSDRVRVTATFLIPNRVTRLDISLPSKSKVVRSGSFTADNGDLGYQLYNPSTRASITYDVNPDKKSDRFGGYKSIDYGQWALVTTDTIGISSWGYRWEYGDEPKVSTSISIVGNGTAGTTVGYLGSARVYNRSIQDQTVRLVIPTETGVNVTDTFEIINGSATFLRVGDRDPSVTAFVAPPPIRRGGAALHASYWNRKSPKVSEDMWVQSRSTASVWAHEYTHTRQGYVPSEKMAWIDEGIAEYYEHLLSVYVGSKSYETFRYEVTATSGKTPLHRKNVGMAEYTKGAHVIAALDVKIRAETDGKRSFQDVFERLNNHHGMVTYGVFADIVADVAGTSFDKWLNRYIDSKQLPPLPDEPTRYTPTWTSDFDGDGLARKTEAAEQTSPFTTDTEEDGLTDKRELENLPTNATISDTDSDGLSDGSEVTDLPTNPTEEDTDNDGLQDWSEVKELSTNPTREDSDGDMLSDKQEVENLSTVPTEADTDRDGLSDKRELSGLGTNATNNDTDNDGLSDKREVKKLSANATKANSDQDQLSDRTEIKHFSTNPSNSDTDNDSYTDSKEVELGLDPTNHTGLIAYRISRLLSKLT